jgi:hypothetical protein
MSCQTRAMRLAGRLTALCRYALVAVSAFQGIYLILAPFVIGAFGWRLYKRVGGSVELQEIYRTSQVRLSL